jgi:outer membrane protein
MKRKAALPVSTLFLLAFAACHLAAQSPADTLTLETLIQRVVADNPSVARTSQLAQAARAGADISRSNYYPDVKAEVAYERLGPIAVIDFPGLGALRLNPANNYDGHVGIKQKLYDFGKTAASVNTATLRGELAQDRVDDVRRVLAYSAVQSFYAILFVQQSLHVQDEQIATLTEHLTITEKKVETGSGTDLDVLTTRVRIAAAEDKKVDLQNRLHHEEIALRKLASLPSSTPLILQGEVRNEESVMNEDSLWNLAASQRTDIRVARDAVHLAESQLDVAGMNSNPSVNVNFSAGLRNGYIPNLDVLRGNYATGVSVEVPIFDGHKTESMQDEARANLLAAQQQVREAENDVRSELGQALADIDASRRKLSIAQLSVEQAETALSMAKVKYESGVVTNLDLLDAGTAVEEAKLNYLRAEFGLVLSTYSLRRSVGEKIW